MFSNLIPIFITPKNVKTFYVLNAIKTLNVVPNCFCHWITIHLLIFKIYLVSPGVFWESLIPARIISPLFAFDISTPFSIYFIMFLFLFYVLCFI